MIQTNGQTIGQTIGQTTGQKRELIDKFYTSSSAVGLCIDKIKQHINISRTDLIIEPSAGNGAFIDGIKILSNNYKFYDIKPEHPEIVKQDYLQLQVSPITSPAKIHVIGNPPFGRQSSLAIKFIKKSCEFCDTLSFILPLSFKKDSLRAKMPIQFHLVTEITLPKKSFIIDEHEHDVPCVFQIWEKRDHSRGISKKLEPTGYKFVKKTENPDMSFRRVGINAGTITDIIDAQKVQCFYFIKFTNGHTVKENMDKLKNIQFVHNNTVGPRSISKQELIIEFNKVI
jgi:predicted RNA methylase